ncbi:unnamed protein product [Ilex paraguariensis]|uniref:Uncharacterized protein n=1 Tax=Ilex paraguariensis TaxID=185542 RepID=A0ABC8U6H6_9AQUA
MCYPAVYWVCLIESSGHQGRGLVLQAATAVEEVGRQQAPVDIHGIASGGGGAGGGVMNQCVCSPTRHPGSFKCRHHHTEYKWVGRLGAKPRLSYKHNTNQLSPKSICVE